MEWIDSAKQKPVDSERVLGYVVTGYSKFTAMLEWDTEKSYWVSEGGYKHDECFVPYWLKLPKIPEKKNFDTLSDFFKVIDNIKKVMISDDDPFRTIGEEHEMNCRYNLLNIIFRYLADVYNNDKDDLVFKIGNKTFKFSEMC